MSTAPRDDHEDNDVLVPDPALPDRTDGSTELDQRTAMRFLFNDPAARNFLFAGLGALGMIFLVLFEQGSDIGGLLLVLIGVCGLLLRWVAAPVFMLLVLTYFMVFPFGIPGESFDSKLEIEEGKFRVTDMLLVLSMLVYIACQYRVFGFVHQAIAYEGQVRRRDEPVTRRPPAIVGANELAVLLGVAGGLVIVGQLIWWFANGVEIVPAEDFPLKFAESGKTMRPDGESAAGGLSSGLTRFVLLVGLLFFGMLVARLVFGYWRLRMMGAAEGGMILLDNGWAETHRERARQEKWRIWGRKRAEVQSKTEQTRTGEK